MTVMEWPDVLMSSESDDWRLVGSTMGDRTVAGFPNFRRLDGGGLWTLQISNILLSTPDEIRAWDAVTGLLDDGVSPVAVPYCIRETQPFPNRYPASVPHSDGTSHSDGSLYSGRRIDCSLEDPELLRSTRVKIRRHAASPFRGGERFEIDDAEWGPRLYKVIKVFGSGKENVVDVEIRPPLRAAAAAGIQLEFDKPRCTMTVADPASLFGPTQQRRFGQRSPSFIEFGRLRL